jgi:hypothetical protein
MVSLTPTEQKILHKVEDKSSQKYFLQDNPRDKLLGQYLEQIDNIGLTVSSTRNEVFLSSEGISYVWTFPDQNSFYASGLFRLTKEGIHSYSDPDSVAGLRANKLDVIVLAWRNAYNNTPVTFEKLSVSNPKFYGTNGNCQVMDIAVNCIDPLVNIRKKTIDIYVANLESGESMVEAFEDVSNNFNLSVEPNYLISKIRRESPIKGLFINFKKWISRYTPEGA